MVRIGFFRTPRPRKFNYVPMYYNAEKEAIKEKIKRIEAKYKVESSDNKEYVPGIRRGSMRNYFKTASAKSKKRSNLRLLIVLVVLLLIAYYLVFGYKF